jgi:chromate transporter
MGVAGEDGTKAARPSEVPLRSVVGYFLKLGTIGFGGPVALVGYMRRDLVEARRWIGEDEYALGLALAQIMPGPLAAQLAMALGFFRRGFRGALLTGLAFVLPSFVMVVALGALYVALGGLWWMRALFYGVAACVIAIIALSAWRLAEKTNRRDGWLWGISVAVGVVTVALGQELVLFVLVAGLGVLFARAPPAWLRRAFPRASLVLPFPLLALASVGWWPPVTAGLLLTILLFFAKAGAFVFGSGLAIVPFLHQGVVTQYHWLSEPQFLDAVAVAMITPGPVVITVGFIGYLVAGFPGAAVAALGMFAPIFLLTILPVPWFARHRDNRQLRAFVSGATAAAVGCLAGAVVILGVRAIVDAFTIAIAVATLAVLLLWRKAPEPLLVVAAGAVSLAWVASGHAPP